MPRQAMLFQTFASKPRSTTFHMHTHHATIFQGETCGSAQIGSSVQTPHAAAHTHSWVPSHHHQPWRFVRSQARGLCTGTIRDKQQDGSSQQDAAAAAKEELITDIAASLAAIGLEPGLDCVVGDGLATIDVALFVEGHQVSRRTQPLNISLATSMHQRGSRHYIAPCMHHALSATLVGPSSLATTQQSTALMCRTPCLMLRRSPSTCSR